MIKIINAILTFLPFNPNPTFEAKTCWPNYVPNHSFDGLQRISGDIDQCVTTPSAPSPRILLVDIHS